MKREVEETLITVIQDGYKLTVTSRHGPAMTEKLREFWRRQLRNFVSYIGTGHKPISMTIADEPIIHQARLESADEAAVIIKENTEVKE